MVPLLRNRSLSSGELEVHRRWRAADMLVRWLLAIDTTAGCLQHSQQAYALP